MILPRAALAFAIAALSGNLAFAAYIAPLDGTSQASTFEYGQTADLPLLGWINVSGTARIFDSTDFNGVIIHRSQARADYAVQHTTSTSVEPLTRYTLSLQMGFAGAGTTSWADYELQLGTVDGSNVFTPLDSETGTVPYGNNITQPNWNPTTASLVVETGSVVSGDPLAVRWAQTDRDPAGVSWFGFDNVILEVEPIPEPGALLLLPAAALVVSRRRPRTR